MYKARASTVETRWVFYRGEHVCTRCVHAQRKLIWYVKTSVCVCVPKTDEGSLPLDPLPIHVRPLAAYIRLKRALHDRRPVKVSLIVLHVFILNLLRQHRGGARVLREREPRLALARREARAEVREVARGVEGAPPAGAGVRLVKG